jgi:hypothetical protein
VLEQPEEWNGTNWTEVANLNTARTYLGGSSTSAVSAVAMGGETPSGLTGASEEWGCCGSSNSYIY